MKKMILILAALIVVAVAVGVGCQATRAGYESADYKMIRRDGAFEVRDYPVQTLVETSMAANQADGSFGRLFNFISGGNDAEQKIAMTTPVYMAGDATNATMAFVMPATMTTGQVPAPTDAAVKIREVPAGRFAVFRFGGGRNAKNEAAVVAKLAAWMKAEKLTALSEPIFGYFDPPWTPTLFRRNEVMIRIGA